MKIKGREKEINKLTSIVSSDKSEFVAVYGRRRVGKTFLVRQYFNDDFSFFVTGLNQVSYKEQLQNFHTSLQQKSKKEISFPANWFEAFSNLQRVIEKDKKKKKIIFIDELPWFDMARTGFLGALEHFWNHWASGRNDIILIICGSAASWIIRKIIKNKGGLHNRITQRIKISPFNLHETNLFLKSKNVNLNHHQTIELYMIYGGIPYYLDSYKKDMSLSQNINTTLFDTDGALADEFENLYASLFKNYKRHLEVVEVLSKKKKGLNREEILKDVSLKDGGTFTDILTELEESGFIRKYQYYQNKKQFLYQLIDFYTLFYFNFIKPNKGNQIWDKMIDHPKHRAWAGYSFELVCILHENQIKKSLGISGVLTEISCWKSKKNDIGTQIDLVIDRRDEVITLCEVKHSINTFIIDKKYNENLENKIAVFRHETGTKKAVQLALVTTKEIQKNQYSQAIVQKNITAVDLFNKEDF